MKLTDRLQCIAEEISRGETMADIGTDHGFLPIALAERGICPRVIMTDVSPGSLTKAEGDLSDVSEELAGCLPGSAALRLGDGLQVLEPGEVDDIVIAGMGGILITQILGEDLPKTRSFRKFILQPRNNVGRLRAWLLDSGFRIRREQIVRERRFLCEVLTASPESGGAPERLRQDAYGTDPELTAALDYPESLLTFRETDPALLQEYLTRRREKHEKVLREIRRSSGDGAGRKAALEEARIRQLTKLGSALGRETER